MTNFKSRILQALTIIIIILLASLCLRPHMDWKLDMTENGDNCYLTTLDNITYVFPEKDFNKKQASNYVSSISQILEYADKIFPTDNSAYSLRIGFTDSAIQLDKTNPNYDDLWEAVKQVHSLSVDKAEYYGLFAVYAKQHNLVDDDFAFDMTDTLNEDNLYLLDFTLPMLDNVYFDKDQAHINRQIVIAFSDWYVQTNSLDNYQTICQSKPDMSPQLVEAKNEWLRSIGSELTYSEYGKIQFHYTNTDDATYKIETDDAVWLWSDADVQSLGYKEMIKNHNIIEPLRIQDFADARDFLKDYLPEKLDKVYIKTQFTSGADSYSAYTPNDSTITLTDGWTEAGRSLLHEYCHYLTVGDDRILSNGTLFDECYAVELSSIELENRMKERALLDYFGEDSLKDMGYWDNITNEYSSRLGTYRDALKNMTARNICTDTGIDTDTDIDIGTDIDTGTDTNIDTPLTLDALSYAEQGALSKYIIETKSFDYFVEMTQTQYNYEAYLGESLNELYSKTQEWLTTKTQTSR